MDQIIETLKCNKCKHYLTPPISQCIQGHLVCSNCFGENACSQCQKPLMPVLNTTLGKIARSLKFPCMHKQNGCEGMFKWDEINGHEADCDFRCYACPLTVKGCRWIGLNADLQDHFLQKHADSVVNYIDNLLIYIDLSSPYHKITLVTALNQVFLLHLIRGNKAGYTSAVMQYVGPKNDSEKYCFEMGMHTQNDNANYTFRAFVNSNRSNVLKPKNRVVLSDIYVCCNEGNTCKLTIKNTNRCQPDDKVLKAIECPVCTEYMLYPIYICSRGHNLCGSCKTKINVCPSCKVRLSDSRNIALEGIAEKAIVPCAFHSNGCSKTGTVEEMEEHGCNFGIYGCTENNCEWQGKLDSLVSHVEKEHEGKIIENDSVNKLYIGSGMIANGVEKSTLVFLRTPFVFYKKCNDIEFLHFAVMSYNNSSSYKYTITIKKDSQLIVNSEVCINYKESIEDVWRHNMGIAVLKSKLKQMAENDTIEFKISVEKINKQSCH